MSGKLVLVTGVTGFIAGHVANQLIEKGYRVRGTTRGAKVNVLRENFKNANYEFVQVDDLVSGDLTEALKDVWGVVHVASPLPGRTNVQDTLDSAVQGTLNLVRQAQKAGVTKLVVTGTFGSVMDPSLRPGFAGITFTESIWGETSREEAEKKAEDPYYVYFASKILSERALWQFAKEHSELDITTILPGFVYGPYANGYPLPTQQQLGTNGLVFALAVGGQPPQPPPFVADVRDVARAHVNALDLPPNTGGKERRYFINGGNLSWKDAAAHLQKTHPELGLDAAKIPDLPGPASSLDMSRSINDLKLGKVITPEECIDAAVDALLALKKTW